MNHYRGQAYRAGGVAWALAVANRNFIIHRYDEINLELTWPPRSADLPAWNVSLQARFDEAETALGAGD